MEDESSIEYILRRNRELGQVLKKAREMAHLLQKDCAETIGTYRQRYAAIERGEEPVGAAELEVLVRYLNIPTYAVWLSEQAAEDRVVYVQHQEGESIHIIVGPYDPHDVPATYSRELSKEGRRLESLRWNKRPR